MTTSVSTRTAGTLNPTRQQLEELDALLQRMLELPVQPLEEPEQTESEEPADEPSPAVTGKTPVPPPPLPIVPGKEPRPTPAPLPFSYMVVETASPRPLPPASGFEPAPTATPRLVPVTPAPPPVPQANEGEMWVPLRSTWHPSPSTWPPLAESWHQANGAAPPLAETPLPTSEAPVPQPASEALVPQPTSETPVLPSRDRQGGIDRQDAGPTPPAFLSDDRSPEGSEPRLSLSAEDAPVATPWLLLPLLWFNQGFDACLAPLGAPGRWVCGRGRNVLGLIGLACLAAAVILAVCSEMGWTW